MQDHIGISVSQHLIITQHQYHPDATGDFNILLNEILVVGKIVRNKIALSGIAEQLGENLNQTNVHGESMKNLDQISNELFKTRLLATGLIASYASEEDQDVTNADGKYTIAIDPCDGSSNIDCNVPVGTIFGIWKKGTELVGRNMVCSGYLLYGPSCMFVYTTGHGVNGFTYDPSIGEFILTHQNIKLPKHSKCYSINESYSQQWSDGVKKLVEWIKTPNKEEKRPYTARYVGSLVSDFHRNLLYGGIFIYPTDKLRLLYECNPLSFIVEQAGGMGIDGKTNILDIIPNNIHHRTPLYIGNKSDVLKAHDFLNDNQTLQIYSIEEKPEAYELVGKYHWNEWKDLYQDWGFDGPVSIANKWHKLTGQQIPKLFVGFIGDKFIGTVASVLDDMPGKDTGYMPWLSVLFVIPEYRKQGIATKLMEHCKSYFKSLGYKECYLWAEKPQWEAVYSKLGWTTVEKVDYSCYNNVPIMRIDL
ncbi:fructose-1,6-bisphosphatase [Klosneuvirus KNV1]|uniref:fructose-bisphosphatase n=1 Tax=Klosneuvirus KNV1 TaxID=1977640 RepID=A0A1V0SKX4_9VIRU|nr:fructose-1,6-bisphosphatase [Klosneuvirus KNV1]